MAMNNIEMTEQLFSAIDAIVTERLRTLPYDKTVIATIIENKQALNYKYRVTTDDNITFDAYSDITTYTVGTRVYVRIPEGDYTKQKMITQKWVPIYNPEDAVVSIGVKLQE